MATEDPTRRAFEEAEERGGGKSSSTFYVVFCVVTWVILLLFAGLLGYYAYEATHDNDNDNDNPQTPSVCLDPACVQVSSAFIAAADPSISPCYDFYRSACGSWINDTEIPADLPSWSIPRQMEKTNQDLLRKLLETPSSTSDTATQAKVKQFYAQCMDLTAIDQQGTAPVSDLYAFLNWTRDASSGWTNDDMIALSNRLNLLANFAPIGVLPFFQLTVQQSNNNSSKMGLYLNQAGLQLPREYYLPPLPNQTSPYADQLDAYESLLETLFGLMGEENPETMAMMVMQMETEMASFSVPLVVQTDVYASNNPMAIDTLIALCPNLPWSDFFPIYFAGLNLTSQQAIQLVNDTLIVTTPPYFGNLTAFLGRTTPEAIMVYLRAKLIVPMAATLSAPFRSALEKFNEALSGTTSAPPRWKDCVAASDQYLGFALGKLYIDVAFPGTSKQIARDLVKNIIGAFLDNLPNVSWLDDPTRKLAADKARAVSIKIGYPDFLNNQTELNGYYTLANLGSAYSQSVQNLSVWIVGMDKAKLQKPANRDEWLLTPQTVNAYYNPPSNEIVFPAGILQPPVFSKDYPLAVNYGAIGFVIGHELTHGFDNSGSQYDAEGNLHMWWPEAVQAKFKNQTLCMAQQYSAYGLQIEGREYFVNGDLTLGENIADNGGLKLAYSAFQKTDPKLSPSLPGLNLTSNQLFFRSFTSFWWGVARPEYSLFLLNVDVHSPAMYRVIGPASNSASFSDAYKCPLLTPMHPAKTCEVW